MHRATFAAALALAAVAALSSAVARALADQSFTVLLSYPTTDCSGPPNSNQTLSAGDGSCLFSPFSNVPNTPYAAATSMCAGGAGSALTGKLFTDNACSNAAASAFDETTCVPGNPSTMYKSLRVVCGAPVKAALLIRQYVGNACTGVYRSAAVEYPLDVCLGTIYSFSVLNASYVGLYSFNNPNPATDACAGAPVLAGYYGPLDACLPSGLGSGSMVNSLVVFPSASPTANTSNVTNATKSPKPSGAAGARAWVWAIVVGFVGFVVGAVV